jgi:type I site-specific restriction endonuclease
LLILNIQVAILQNSRAQGKYKSQIIEIAKGLEDKSNIPHVANQMELILDLQTANILGIRSFFKLEAINFMQPSLKAPFPIPKYGN